jgi:hypothetical protein
MLFSGSSDPISPQQLPNWSYTGFVPIQLNIIPPFVFVNTKNEQAVMLALILRSQNATLLDKFSAPCWHGHNNKAYFSYVLRQD